MMENNNTNTLVAMMKVITAWRKFFFYSVGFSILLSLIIAFVIPVQFKSVASVLPAEQTDLFGSIEGISSIAKSFSSGKGLSALKGNDELDRYMAILKSGKVLSRVIEEFDLIKVYDITTYPMEKTTKELLENVEFFIEDEGYLTVTVYDEDPERAAKMANFFIDELNKTNSELKAKNASSNRSFIESRYRKNLLDLAAAEDSLKAFQKRYGVIAMPEQTTATIKAGSLFASELALKEVQYEVESRVFSSDNSNVKSLKIEIEEMRKKLHSMNQSSPGTAQNSDMNFLVPLSKIPDLGAEYLRRFREVEIQYKILQFLTPMYEQSKVEEQRQTPSVIVLDRASPAERKSRPKRTLIVLGGFLIGLLSASVYVGAHTRWQREKEQNSELYHSVSNFFRAVRFDMQRSSKQ